MNTPLYTIPANFEELKAFSSNEAIDALESGKVIFLPQIPFSLSAAEERIYKELNLDGKHKNLSFHPQKNQLGGISSSVSAELACLIESFMQRFSQFSKHLVDSLLPQYQDHLEWGRTSYRPVEIRGRKSSKRKDDTRLHVDSFPASPVNGKRILRVFSNINPNLEPRVWHLGDPFAEVVNKFAPTVPPYRPVVAKILKWVKATKTLRSAYDHQMLHIHDHMKLDDDYQRNLQKKRIEFPAYSTWIVFTDHVSHAALSGKHLLEQTFYLSPEKMVNKEKSPLYVLSKKVYGKEVCC